MSYREKEKEKERAALMNSEQIPLVEAARRLQISWASAWRALLVGRLDGEKIRGRWFVTRASVKYLAAQREGERERAGSV